MAEFEMDYYFKCSDRHAVITDLEYFGSGDIKFNYDFSSGQNEFSDEEYDEIRNFIITALELAIVEAEQAQEDAPGE